MHSENNTAWPRLTHDWLDKDDAYFDMPAYDLQTAGISHAHIGVGAFFRAHQAVYNDMVMNSVGGDWRIHGLSMRSNTAYDMLQPQDFLYSVTSSDGDTAACRIIGALATITSVADAPQKAIDVLADPAISIVTLTITEAGYCLDPKTQRLDTGHADILHDTANLSAPRSAVGLLVAALRARRQAGVAFPTILSCDNLAGNGDVLKRAVLDFAALAVPDMVPVLNTKVAFPSTMVDRITPKATDEHRVWLAGQTGLWDAGAIKAEAFSQWVIEDHFVAPRPTWEQCGVKIVPDVRPYEELKLRLLNGAHSAVAYLGWLAGYEFVADAMKDQCFSKFIEALQCEELAPSLPVIPDVQHADYAATVRQRFKNPELRHATEQIAMDGSQKLPVRIMPAIAHQLKTGGPLDRLCLVIAGWTRYLEGANERGERIQVRDPLAGQLHKIVEKARAAQDKRASIYWDELPIWDDAVKHHPRLLASFTRMVNGLQKNRVLDMLD